MTITFYGEGCFKLQSGETTILTDPIDSKSGLTAPRFKYDILLKTLMSFPPVIVETKENYEGHYIVGAGEYNIKNIDIIGFPVVKESTDKFLKTVYLIKIEGIKICLLGHIADMPELEISSHLEEVDILIVPGSGNPFIDQKSLLKLIRQIEPKIVIPCFHKVSGLKRQAGDLKVLIEEFNHKQVEPQEKLTIKKKDLDEMKKTELTILKI